MERKATNRIGLTEMITGMPQESEVQEEIYNIPNIRQVHKYVQQYPIRRV